MLCLEIEDKQCDKSAEKYVRPSGGDYNHMFPLAILQQ